MPPVPTHMVFLIVVAVVALLAGPVLALAALASVRRLENQLAVSQIRELTSRVYALELLARQLESRNLPPVEKPAVAAAPPSPVESRPASDREPPSLQPQSVPAVPAISGGGRIPGVSAREAAEPQPKPHGEWSPELESVIGGRWLNRIGIVALLVAVSYFLKLAFDNNWIGPAGRVATGIVLGALMLPWSQWLAGRGYSYFSDGIAALGQSTLFLSVWAGCQYYLLYSRAAGFAALISITVVMAALAIGRNSERIAVMSLLGGLLAPILASSGQDQQVALFAYLLLLGAGALVIAAKMEWSSLVPVFFVGTQCYFWAWYNQFFHRTSPVERTLVFASLFFLLYLCGPVGKAVRGAALREVDILVVVMSEFAYCGALFVLLWPDGKWPLTSLLVLLAAAHAAAARLLRSPKPAAPAVAERLFAGLALTYLTLVIPVRFEGQWVTFGFAAEGAVLVWTGFRAVSHFLRQAGYFLLAIAALRLLFETPSGGALLFNPRFAAYAVVIACFGVALGAARGQRTNIAGQERAEIGLFAVAINVYALIALSAELWDYFGKTRTAVDATLARHLALSILWTVYATALIVFGVQRKSALMRWQGLALFGLVAGKVFLYDLSFLERAYRVLSFLVLGAILLAVSFFYQRRLERERTP